jgi:hypothetical protein
MGWIRVAVIAIGVTVAAGAAGVGYVQSIIDTPGKAVVVPSSLLAGVSASDARLLGDFYSAMADIVVRDGLSQAPVCKTTFDLRNRHKQALEFAFANTGMVGKYDKLGARLDEYLLSAIGALDVPLTTENRQAAAKAFAAVK